MTDNDIIKALESYTWAKLYHEKGKLPKLDLGEVLDLINRQNTEIERLTADLKTTENIIKNNFLQKAGFDIDPLAEFKAEAVKEFAERLKDSLDDFYHTEEDAFLETNDLIDNLVNEMVGE